MIQKGVYCLIFPNGKRYVGYSCDKNGIVSRWWNHKCEAYRKNGKDYNTKKNRAIRKYGWENIEKKILIISEDVSYCKDMETSIIDAWNLRDDNYGYNMTAGGDGITGVSRIFTKEHRENLSKSLKGHRHTYETKKRMSESHKGKKPINVRHGKEHPSAKIRMFRNIQTGEIIEGIVTELCREYGWNLSNMSHRKKSGGWEMLIEL